MLVRLSLILATIVVLAEQYESVHGVLPDYIRKAHLQKDQVPPQLRRQRTKTLRNLTIHEVFDRIKEITRSLNLNAMRNGYKVDYKLRVLDKK